MLSESFTPDFIRHMGESEVLTIVFVFIVYCYGLFSRKFEHSPLTGPLALMLMGILIGPILGWIHQPEYDPENYEYVTAGLDIGHGLVHQLIEVALILILFLDASRIDFGFIRRNYRLPMRLLAISLPLTMVLGGGVCYLLVDGYMQANPEFVATSTYIIVILSLLTATMLAPTDAALGLPVVESEHVPSKIRKTLVVESGLNDGIALPLVLFLLAFAKAYYLPEEDGGSTWDVTWELMKQISIGALIGIGFGTVGGKMIEWATDHHWTANSFKGMNILVLAIAAAAWAHELGGNGFVAGFCMGNLARITPVSYNLIQDVSQMLMLLTFFIFGAVFIPRALDDINMYTVIGAVLMLTVVRMVPTLISLSGTHLKWHTKVFIGWFGPRGLASILFSLLIVEAAAANIEHDLLIVNFVTITDALSTVLHGITAYPWGKWYGTHMERLAKEAEIVEYQLEGKETDH